MHVIDIQQSYQEYIIMLHYQSWENLNEISKNNRFCSVFFCSKEARWSEAYESQTPQVNVASYDKY